MVTLSAQEGVPCEKQDRERIDERMHLSAAGGERTLLFEISHARGFYTMALA